MVFALLSLILGQAPPPTHKTWCADAHQYLTVNGTMKQSETFHLCLDSTPGSLRWSRTKAGAVDQYFNGTTRFDVMQNGSCVATFFGPAKPGQLPWSFVEIDANATFNRTEHYYDGFKDVNVWTVFRPAKTQPIHIQAQLMEWRIENTSSSATKEFLSASCIQKAFPPSPPGLMQDGVRDFSGKYTTPAPVDSFTPPAGVKCQAAPGSKPWVPDDGCKPACGTGSLCCRDPAVSPPGYCLGVTSCAEIHGGLVAWSF